MKISFHTTKTAKKDIYIAAVIFTSFIIQMSFTLSLSYAEKSPLAVNFTKSQAPNWTQESCEKISPAMMLDANLWESKSTLQNSLEFSLKYLQSDQAEQDYQRLDIPGIDRDRVKRSVLRFATLLEQNDNFDELSNIISKEFVLVKPQINSVEKPVKFTGYFQPTYFASRRKTAKFKYPIYKLPEDFASWPQPQPKRVYLEGYIGQGNPNSPLYGNELAYLSTRWEAFMIHVQGSAILMLDDETEMAIGFAGATNYPFKGIPKDFMKQHQVSWTKLEGFFTNSPDLLNQILINNNRFIFFKENADPLPVGCLGVPVVAERSIATDKSIMPPGALSVVSTQLPFINSEGKVELKPGLRFVLDQDTGSAIKGSARVDIFMGTGPNAQKKANAVYSKGDLYYLLLR